MPAPLARGGRSSCTMPPRDGGRWLRALLAGEGVPEEVLSSLGTRSCKAAVLSWVAKGGLG
eukprot:11015833-Alexandrium_andersonii.AAC.1